MWGRAGRTSAGRPAGSLRLEWVRLMQFKLPQSFRQKRAPELHQTRRYRCPLHTLSITHTRARARARAWRAGYLTELELSLVLSLSLVRDLHRCLGPVGKHQARGHGQLAGRHRDADGCRPALVEAERSSRGDFHDHLCSESGAFPTLNVFVTWCCKNRASTQLKGNDKRISY